MKKFFLISLILTFVVTFGQQIDSRLKAVYSQDYLNSLDSKRIKELTLTLDSSYYIIDNFPKINSIPELKKVDISTKQIINEPIKESDLQNFNIFLYDYKRNYDSRTYYKLGNTGKTIAFYSIKELVKIINRNL